MKTQNKFWWFVTVALSATLAVLGTIVILFWQQLAPDQKKILLSIVEDNVAYFFVALFLLFSLFGFTLDWFFRFYIIPINQLTEKLHLISTVNPALRIRLDGAYDVMRLAEVINQSAERQQDFRQTIEKELAGAKAETEAERNILAAILEDLPQGILICNLEGQIVFYNRRIKTVLSDGHAGLAVEGVGLDRSVYAFIDRVLIDRALERIGRKLTQGERTAGERFLLGSESARMQPVELLPVLDSQHHMTGFVLFFEENLSQSKDAEESNAQLQKWQHQLIQCIAVIKSTAEIMHDESSNLPTEKAELVRILAKEAELAAGLVASSSIPSRLLNRQPLPLTVLDIPEFSRLLMQRVQEITGIDFEMPVPDIQARISIDIYHLTHAMAYVFLKLRGLNIAHFQGVFSRRDGWLYLDIIWKGSPIDGTTLNGWKEEIPRFENHSLSNSVADILERHGAKLWLGRRPGVDEACVMLLLPLVEGSEIVIANERVTVLPDSRPEFYDFNLFRQSGQTPELDQRLLSELSYTVFDTETTGLDPQAGDEIISIGAVRIIHGRLLREECFDQLIDPRRTLPWASIKFHGIRPEMLANQPGIEAVLPRFHRFAQRTILVGHNVAFDMRMLQVKETVTQVRFENPVLDTMLLSALTNPAHPDHGLDAVAERLGVTVVGRHTALGDAVATAEIFLKLLAMLAENGITTLQQARQASEKTYLARLKY